MKKTASVVPTVAIVLVTVVALAGCQVEERPVGPVFVRPDTPDTELVSISDVMADDALIGTVKVYRFEGSTRTVANVHDHKGRPVGYITDSGQAYRVRAHGGTDLVAGSDDMRANVAALLGRPATKVELKVDERIR